MSLLSRLFGGGSKAAPEPNSEEYQGYKITPNAQKAENGYRIGAVIEKDGREHRLIRADIIGDFETAQRASISKAQQLIDQMGMNLFSN